MCGVVSGHTRAAPKYLLFSFLLDKQPRIALFRARFGLRKRLKKDAIQVLSVWGGLNYSDPLGSRAVSLNDDVIFYLGLTTEEKGR